MNYCIMLSQIKLKNTAQAAFAKCDKLHYIIANSMFCVNKYIETGFGFSKRRKTQ